MIYKTWHERERLQWYSRIETKRGRERKRICWNERGVDIQEGDQTGVIYGLNEWRGKRERERETDVRGRWRGRGGVVAWRFHYSDVSLRQTYAPNVVPALPPYISLPRYFIFIRPA